MFRAEKVCKIFSSDILASDVVALDGVSFEVKQGDIKGFLGANGAGKTTFLKILMGFISVTSGQIVFSQTLGHRREEINAKIGYMPERPYFYPHLRGKDFLIYMACLNDVPKKIINERITDLSRMFKIDHALSRPIRSYSKGMLQRLGLVSAMLHDPEIIVLDEPVAGMDPVGRREIKDVIFKLKEKGKTIFMSSHIVSDIEEVCDSVILLERGKLIYDGKINDLIEKHTHNQYRIQISLPAQIPDNLAGFLIGENLLEVPIDKKNDVLKQLLELGIGPDKVWREVPSLEQIIYEVGN